MLLSWIALAFDILNSLFIPFTFQPEELSHAAGIPQV